MAREVDRLTARGVQTKRTPGYFADGGGLYLQVSKSGAKSWVFCYMLKGKSREMGLGSALRVPLVRARELRDLNRDLLAAGKDPIEERNAALAREASELAGAKTFRECALAYIEANRPTWKNAKHADQWANTLATYAFPRLGLLPVRAVDTGQVHEVLQPIWTAKRETANRVRGRVEKILDWATVLGYRSGPNPARWRGHLDQVLAKDQKRRRVKHHAALPVEGMGAFMAEVREQEGEAARALEFLILTAARTGEVLGGQPGEINAAGGRWTVPAGRMKGEREHRVPLSPQALRIVTGRNGEYLFAGGIAGKPLSNMAMLELLRRMGREDITVHGFRSTFRDWASERTNFPREVAEAALAHAIGDETEAAYRRGDLFDKRRQLMDAWAKFCDRTASEGSVVPLRGRQRG